jgi:alkylation response protein AidB-like acyl-CoA dehydrogenase
MESVEAFRLRARAWLAANCPRDDDTYEWNLAEARKLQAQIWEAGFGGIAFPRAYGGAGLTFDHQAAYAEETAGYVTPAELSVSIGMLAPTVLDHGSEAFKVEHLPRMLRGDEVWIQLLSEPSGGSDVAGALTRAERDGDSWVINGAKVWSTGADKADYGLCLVRTDWDVPKHAGLSMIAVPMRSPGLEIRPTIDSKGGPPHFFEETFVDVRVPLENLIGEVNDGWAVTRTLLKHERNTTAGAGHGLGVSGQRAATRHAGPNAAKLRELARRLERLDDPLVRQRLAEAQVIETVARQLRERVMRATSAGVYPGEWGSLLKLGLGTDTPRLGEIALDIAGPRSVVWDEDLPESERVGLTFIGIRAISIAGGTNEIQRNIVSERLLGMPKEPAADRGIPFREARRG